ncbi:MAG: LysO family transporter [Prevotella sp.]|nr:LysO family transporter [Prevotella sp.]
MLQVIAVMVVGILVGYLLRGRRVKALQPAITVLIWALLFLLGIEVGHNRRIIAGLPTLGLEALIISALALAGSLLLAWLLWTVIRRKPSHRP